MVEAHQWQLIERDGNQSQHGDSILSGLKNARAKEHVLTVHWRRWSAISWK